MNRNLRAEVLSLIGVGILAVLLFLYFKTQSESSRFSVQTQQRPELIIATYQSWVTEGSLGAEIIPVFEARHACKVRVMTASDAGSVVSRLEFDAKRHQALQPHLVVGIDQYLWSRALPWAEAWSDDPPEGYSKVPTAVRVSPGFFPYAVSSLAFMSDRTALKLRDLSPPQSLMDLLRPEWRRQLLIEDPRTSTPGLVFLLYTFQPLGEQQAIHFWKGLREQWLTLPPTWSAAYSLFLRKQAPLVWTYVSSQAYHQKEQQPQYQILNFREGQPLQIEGAFLVKHVSVHPQQRELAKKFLEFLISKEVQEKVPDRNWMFPVRKEVALPPAYQGIPHPLSQPHIPLSLDASEMKKILILWREAVGAGR